MDAHPSTLVIPKSLNPRNLAVLFLTKYDQLLYEHAHALKTKYISDEKLEKENPETLDAYHQLVRFRTAIRALALSGEINLDELQEGHEALQKLVHRQQAWLAMDDIDPGDTITLSPFHQRQIIERDTAINMQAELQDLQEQVYKYIDTDDLSVGVGF